MKENLAAAVFVHHTYLKQRLLKLCVVIEGTLVRKGKKEINLALC